MSYADSARSFYSVCESTAGWNGESRSDHGRDRSSSEFLGGNTMLTGNWSRGTRSCLLGVATFVCLAGSLAFAYDQVERPPGDRQFERCGKLWPPFARPVGKPARCVDQYHYTKYWPYPHTCEDRNSIRNAMSLQATNGWVEGTTLFSYHFTKETNQLNSAGIAHLEYILFRVPGQHRAAFIQMTNSAQADQARVTNVQAAASNMLQDASLPPIALRRARSYGANAEEIDMISRKFLSGTPVPRLNGNAGSSTGAGATGSGGGSQND